MAIEFWSQLQRRQTQFARASAPSWTVTAAQMLQETLCVHSKCSYFWRNAIAVNSVALYIRVYVFLTP
jgi:hypothetical protein